MAKGLIAEKIGMTQIFNEEGKVIPVTVLRVGPCGVSQVKTVANDGYDAVQLSFGTVKEKSIGKAIKGHLAKAGITALRKVFREFRNFGEEVSLGKELSASDVFQLNDNVKVVGLSKGKGFQGVVKRHGFAGGPKTHGSRFQKHPGSIGAGSTPSRVFKGMKMGGRMGQDQATIRNAKIVRIIEADNLVFVSGNVPGSDTSIVTIEKI
ncbi:50S ribosomal protein L3 [Leptospira sp. GIMC2001]|uniref:50S ribosomal protein L3 n=1 Tax=Leptospira sp. GIMC2001 TaxID=1513297 RepID=UPI00234AF195|nr:50S ribosomal protein L3 [Leptospira sp. GIMC2001]WCL51080.1 50S ribosomal protein L3 [Leptospira sp. GIMC2001]